MKNNMWNNQNSREFTLNTCDNYCWCIFCKQKISKNEKYIRIDKKANKCGYIRINICSRCIKGFSNNTQEKDILSIENQLAIKEIEMEN
jgi:hypothetical protein